jgi:Fanconi anemia group D2 protein
MITSKIPPAKRALERFLFQVKALLHNCSTEKKFWMGKSRHLIHDSITEVQVSLLFSLPFERRKM